MAVASRILAPLVRLVRRARFRLWALRTRLRLARHGCRLELVAPHGVDFGTLPAVESTFQMLDGADPLGPGRLRLELGKDVYLGRGLVIEVLPSGDNEIVFGERVICCNAPRLVLFGGRISVGAWTRLEDGVMLKSAGRLTVGEHVKINRFSMIHCAERVSIGDHVGIGDRVSVLDSDHAVDGSDTPYSDHPVTAAPVTLERNVWLGANSVVLRGASLGRNAVVGAGSVVSGGEYPAGWLIAGSPAEAKKALPAAASGVDAADA